MLILDLYCGAGGASVGYSRAGFTVVGIDIAPQPCYPFPFLQADAIKVLAALNRGNEINIGGTWYALDDFAAIHSSPPCQSQSALTKGTNKGKVYPNLIPATRKLLDATGLLYVIENVQGSELRRDITLCGDMFDLRVIRHRYFELGRWTMAQPPHLTDPRKHKGRVAGMRHGEWFEGPYFAVHGDGGGKGTVQQWKDAMDMQWIDSTLTVKAQRKMIAEAIPPAYGECIGQQLLAHLLTKAAGSVRLVSPASI